MKPRVSLVSSHKHDVASWCCISPVIIPACLSLNVKRALVFVHDFVRVIIESKYLSIRYTDEHCH